MTVSDAFWVPLLQCSRDWCIISCYGCTGDDTWQFKEGRYTGSGLSARQWLIRECASFDVIFDELAEVLLPIHVKYTNDNSASYGRKFCIVCKLLPFFASHRLDT